MARGFNTRLRAQRIDIQNRLDIIAPLYRKGWTEREITAEIRKRLDKPTYNQAHADIQRLIKEWQSARLTDTDAKITAELARLDLVIKEAWTMWEKSKEDYHEKTQAQQGMPNMDERGKLVSIATVKAMLYDNEKRGHGEPRYLDIVLKAMQQRCKLLGLDKTVIDVQAGIDGNIEIRYVDAGIPCATSEEEVRKREGMID